MKFADADSDFDSAHFVIFGIPLDETGSHRKGTGQAPAKIREESYNFETYLYDLQIDLQDVPIHDLGDIKPDRGTICKTVEKIVSNGKFPIAMGGEHSISPCVISGMKDCSVLVLDAHLDFRNEYEGNPNSHACTTRRISEIVGIDNVISIGVRSMCKEELRDARELGFITIDKMSEISQDDLFRQLDEKLSDKIYVSLDMDVIDPSFAPGVGNPEPNGLTPCFVQQILRHFSKRMIGFDVVEVCPPSDNGNTASLAGKIIRDVIGSVGKGK